MKIHLPEIPVREVGAGYHVYHKSGVVGISDSEADHITPWHDCGKIDEENCQMLCRKCNKEKSAK